jgi:hypothetical protein
VPRLSCNVSALCIAIIIHYLMRNHAGLSKMPGFWASEKTPDLGDLEPRPGAAARAWRGRATHRSFPPKPAGGVVEGRPAKDCRMCGRARKEPLIWGNTNQIKPDQGPTDGQQGGLNDHQLCQNGTPNNLS